MTDTLRIICVDVDCGDAANIGGPVHVTHKTFDMPAPPELVAWLKQRLDTYGGRSISGVEVFSVEAANKEAP